MTQNTVPTGEQLPQSAPPGDPVPPAGPPPVVVRETQQAPAEAPRYTAADLERARKEEKDKLYTRLSKVDERSEELASELKTLRLEREGREAEEALRKKADENAAKAKAESEMSAKRLLEERSSEWEARFAHIEKERELERAALAKELEYNKLRAYIQERATAERSNIAPELVDLINGETPEEVDASIQVLKDKTTQIFQSVQEAQSSVRSQMRGVSPTGYTGNGPTDGDSGPRELSAEAIKNMSMPEFAKYRSQLLNVASSQASNRGLFS
ncbi:hypothetical protein ACFQ61_08255 [Streptomyces sp. NPDC056500]|uniref:hypothetical protein n=1 Tax=Streptomyces sp. NPDC056500 TaxID=3345840 RepID=UPI0036BD56D0